MQLRAGTRLKSTVCTTEVIVVKAPDADVEVTCGGAAMGDPTVEPSGAPEPDAAGGCLLGKRYTDPEATIELLCTVAGDGSLAVNGTPLGVQETKPLPASD